MSTLVVDICTAYSRQKNVKAAIGLSHKKVGTGFNIKKKSVL